MSTQAKLKSDKRKQRREAWKKTQRVTSAAHAVTVTQTTSSEIANVLTSQALSSATDTVSLRTALNVE